MKSFFSFTTHMQFLRRVFCISMMFYLLFAAYNFAAANQKSLPMITIAPSRFYPLDEALYLEGTAIPRSKVEIFFEKLAGGTQPIRIDVDANASGEWFFAQKLELSSGEWSVRVRQVSDPISEWSTPRIIGSVVSGFMIGSHTVKYAPIAGAVIVVMFASIGLFLYSMFRVRTVQHAERERAMREKTEHLEQELHKKDEQAIETLIEHNFAEIRRKVMEEIEHLERKRADGKTLSSEEEEHRTTLFRQLREAEEQIEDRVKHLT